jgi:hypothetical protein
VTWLKRTAKSVLLAPAIVQGKRSMKSDFSIGRKQNSNGTGLQELIMILG